MRSFWRSKSRRICFFFGVGGLCVLCEREDFGKGKGASGKEEKKGASSKEGKKTFHLCQRGHVHPPVHRHHRPRRPGHRVGHRLRRLERRQPQGDGLELRLQSVELRDAVAVAHERLRHHAHGLHLPVLRGLFYLRDQLLLLGLEAHALAVEVADGAVELALVLAEELCCWDFLSRSRGG